MININKNFHNKFKLYFKKIKIPKKSIFGFKVLNYNQSIISAYLLLTFSYLLYIKFGSNKLELISGYLFLIISNISLIILIINALSKRIKKFNYRYLVIMPLVIHLPLSLIIILESNIKLFKIINK